MIIYPDIQTVMPFVANATIERRYYDELKQWKELCTTQQYITLYGGVGVGKTTLALSFADTNFETLIYINIKSNVEKPLINAVNNGNNLFHFLQQKKHLEFTDNEDTVIVLEGQDDQTTKALINSLIKLNLQSKFIFLLDTYNISNDLISILKVNPIAFITPLNFEEFYKYFRSFYKLKDCFDLYLVNGGYPAIASLLRQFVNVDTLNFKYKEIIDNFKKTVIFNYPEFLQPVQEEALDVVLNINKDTLNLTGGFNSIINYYTNSNMISNFLSDIGIYSFINSNIDLEKKNIHIYNMFVQQNLHQLVLNVNQSSTEIYNYILDNLKLKYN